MSIKMFLIECLFKILFAAVGVFILLVISLGMVRLLLPLIDVLFG